MARLNQLAHRQKRSRLRDALAALALVGAFAVPAVGMSVGRDTAPAADAPAAEVTDDHADHDHADDACAPTSVSVEC